MRALIVVLAAIVLAGPSLSLPRRCWAESSPAELPPAELYQRSLPAVITVRVTTKDGSQRFGSGFLAIKEGIAVTAWHVVRDAKSVVARFADGEEFDVSGLVDKDEKRDVALIRVKVAGRPALTMVPTDPAVGARAYVIGAPKGLEFSLSDGLVSQVRTQEGVRIYQFTCPASTGNSGGPLLGADGRVLGVVSFQARDGQNLNFAMPATYALGLDASLPTQPWDQIRTPVVEGEKKVVPKEVVSRLLIKAYLIYNDAWTALSYTRSAMTKYRGYAKGVPSSLYSTQRDLDEVLEEVEQLTGLDGPQAALQKYFSKLFPAQLAAMELMALAVDAANRLDGWRAEADDLYSRSSAAQNIRETWPDNAFNAILLFSPQLHTALNRIGYFCENDPRWALGIRSWTRSPLTVVTVKKGSIAEKIGLKASDDLQTAAGKTLANEVDLKIMLEENAGKEIVIEVERGGKVRKLRAKVPKDLAAAAK